MALPFLRIHSSSQWLVVPTCWAWKFHRIWLCEAGFILLGSPLFQLIREAPQEQEHSVTSPKVLGHLQEELLYKCM